MILFRGGLTLSFSLFSFLFFLALDGFTFVVFASGSLVGICCWLSPLSFLLSIAKKGMCVFSPGVGMKAGNLLRLVKVGPSFRMMALLLVLGVGFGGGSPPPLLR